MSYVQGFLVPVRADARDAYRAFAAQTAAVPLDHGATRLVECWGDDVAPGRRTDMLRAVAAQDGETVAFSWVMWPDRATCEAARDGIIADARMQELPDMPFDGSRMVWGGFEIIHDSGAVGCPGYVDGMVAAVPSGDRDAVIAFERATTPIFADHGAARLVGGWSTELAPGTTTDFFRAVDAVPGTAITFGWIEWPDKATRDAGMAAMMQDARMAALTPAWDGPTAIFGGFVPILDTDDQ